jgi:cell division protein FtsN
MAINLLPKDISQKNKVSNRGKSLTYLTYVLLIISALVMVSGALLITTQQRQVNALKTQQKELLSEVEKYQEEEKQLIIVKDRLTLVNGVLSSRELERVRELQRVLYDSMPEGVRVTRQNLSEQGNGFTVQANSASVLREYINEISQKEDFSSITLSQLIYNPLFGYQVEFAIQ